MYNELDINCINTFSDFITAELSFTLTMDGRFIVAFTQQCVIIIKAVPNLIGYNQSLSNYFD